MRVWGKIIGGVGGFAIGGPIGALIGAVAGHAVDKVRGQSGEPEDATKSVAFTIATIALGAKMAKADGHVTRDEVDAFKRVFRVPPEEVNQVLDWVRCASGNVNCCLALCSICIFRVCPRVEHG